MASSAKPPGAPFRFAARHARLDWRLLAELDCDRIWRETDIDALERALDTVCYGDLSVEDPRHVTGPSMVKLFRLAQMQVEYLLHVQETLASHKAELQTAAVQALRAAETARGEARAEREVSRKARKELRSARKALRTYETLEAIRAGVPTDTLLQRALADADAGGDGDAVDAAARSALAEELNRLRSQAPASEAAARAEAMQGLIHAAEERVRAQESAERDAAVALVKAQAAEAAADAAAAASAARAAHAAEVAALTAEVEGTRAETRSVRAASTKALAEAEAQLAALRDASEVATSQTQAMAVQLADARRQLSDALARAERAEALLEGMQGDHVAALAAAHAAAESAAQRAQEAEDAARVARSAVEEAEAKVREGDRRAAVDIVSERDAAHQAVRAQLVGAQAEANTAQAQAVDARAEAARWREAAEAEALAAREAVTSALAAAAELATVKAQIERIRAEAEADVAAAYTEAMNAKQEAAAARAALAKAAALKTPARPAPLPPGAVPAAPAAVPQPEAQPRMSFSTLMGDRHSTTSTSSDPFAELEAVAGTQTQAAVAPAAAARQIPLPEPEVMPPPPPAPAPAPPARVAASWHDDARFPPPQVPPGSPRRSGHSDATGESGGSSARGSGSFAAPALASAAAAFEERFKNAPLTWSQAAVCRFDHSDVVNVAEVRLQAEEDLSLELRKCCAQLGVTADWALEKLDTAAAGALASRWSQVVEARLGERPQAVRDAFPAAKAHLLAYLSDAADTAAEASRRISQRVEALEAQRTEAQRTSSTAAPPVPPAPADWTPTFGDGPDVPKLNIAPVPAPAPAPAPPRVSGPTRRSALAGVMAEPPPVPSSDDDDYY